MIDNQRDLSHYVISPLRTFVTLRILLLDWKKNIEKYTNEKLVTFYISLFSITESVVNPVPVEVILIPSVIKFRKKFIKFAQKTPSFGKTLICLDKTQPFALL